MLKQLDPSIASGQAAILEQLSDLRKLPEQDDEGVLRATKDAYIVASNLLEGAAIILAADGFPIPYGCASTDSKGGVRIEWVRDAASVHLVVPCTDEQEGYVYHEDGTRYATERADAESLARWLRIIKD